MNHALSELWPRMMSVAYRILGSVADAEDAVQEAYVRLLLTDHVTSPEGFLLKATSHRCFDQLRARRIRENPACLAVHCSRMTRGIWATEAAEEPLSTVFLYMLERLTPIEIGVFLLRTAFDFEFVEIAEVMGKARAHTRQILCRARLRLLDREPRFVRTLEEADRVAEKFVAACRSGDIESVGLIGAESRTRRLSPVCRLPGVSHVQHVDRGVCGGWLRR